MIFSAERRRITPSPGYAQFAGVLNADVRDRNPRIIGGGSDLAEFSDRNHHGHHFSVRTCV